MKNKIASAALSALIALLLWLYVITTISPGSRQTFSNVPLVLGNESVLTERGLMITYQSAGAVNLELSGTRADLAKVNSGNITVKADLSNIYEPGNQIAVSYSTSFPGNVANNAFVIESRSPSRIYLNVERRVSKSIPVEVRWTGSVPDGFIADRENKLLEYPTVQISGPESVIGQIDKAIIEADLTDQRESISWDCPYTLCNASDEPVDAGLVTTDIDQIHLEVRVQRVKDIQLTYQLVEGGGARAGNVEIALSIDKIRVCGSEAALEQLGDQLVVGTIDLAEVASDMNKTFTIPLEEGITNLTGISEVTASITLRGLSKKEFQINQINVINVPEGLEVELITQALNLRLRGPVDQIARLKLGDVTVVADFTGAEIGTTTFPVRAVFTDGFRDVGILGALSVSASVMEAGTLDAQTEQPTQPEPVG